METEVPDEIESLLDELTTFQDVVQSDTTIRQILQRMGTLLRNDHFRSKHLNGCKIFLGELMSLCRPTYDLPGGHSTTYDLLNRGRLWLRCYERFYYRLIFRLFYFPSAIPDNMLEVHRQLAGIESKILKILDMQIDRYVNVFRICTLDAETIQRVTHRPWTDQIVAGRQKLEADFNSYMESISSYKESILLNSASSRAPWHRVWDFHQGDSAASRALYSELAALYISAASRALHLELTAHLGSHSQLHQAVISAASRVLYSELEAHLGSPSQLHQGDISAASRALYSELAAHLRSPYSELAAHLGSHSQLHQGDISAASRALYSELAAHLGSHSQLHQGDISAASRALYSELAAYLGSPYSELAAHLRSPYSELAAHLRSHSQLHQGDISAASRALYSELAAHLGSHSQLHQVPSTHPGNHSQLHLVPSTHSGSHVILDLVQDPTGVEEQPLVNRPRLPETFLGITSQAALAMLTISVSGRTSFSQNANILFWSAAACNLIGFLFCLFSILVSGRRTGVAPRIVTGTGFVFTAYGFLAIMGMLLSDNIMLWITGLACIASFPALVSAFMK